MSSRRRRNFLRRRSISTTTNRGNISLKNRSRSADGKTCKGGTSVYSCPALAAGTAKTDILEIPKTPGDPPNRPSGRRRLRAVRAFCRRQNLGAGGIHFRRAFENKGRRPPSAAGTQKERQDLLVMSFFLAQREGFEPSWDCSQTDFESAPL